MIVVNQELCNRYKTNDIVFEMLKKTSCDGDFQFTSQRWLNDSFPKRVMYFHLYGDIVTGGKESCRILDVGGGYSALTRLMIHRHEYTLLDIMSHDDHVSLRKIERESEKKFWINQDWSIYKTSNDYDYVIANDLFPNVDQRLEIFIEKFLPMCCELRLTLTYYNTPCFYVVKRVDADEIFYIQAWDGIQVKRVIENFGDRIYNYNPGLLLGNPPSVFENNRQVCIVSIAGDKKSKE